MVSTLAPLLHPLCCFSDGNEQRDHLVKEAMNQQETKKANSEAKRANTRRNHVEEKMGNKVSKDESEASVRNQLKECGVLPFDGFI